MQKRIVAGLFVVIVLGFVLLKNQNPLRFPLAEQKESATILTPKTESNLSTDTDALKSSDFHKRMEFEVQKISQIDEHPDEIEERLKQFASQLKDSEVELLFETSLDLQKSQDERFLAIMLLGWSNRPQVADLLEKVAVSEIDSFLSPGRKGDFETVLRMKAVEALHDLPLSVEAQQKHLETIINKTSSSQVIDRAQRALWASRGQAESPQKQDEEALQKLLEKSGP